MGGDGDFGANFCQWEGFSVLPDRYDTHALMLGVMVVGFIFKGSENAALSCWKCTCILILQQHGTMYMFVHINSLMQLPVDVSHHIRSSDSDACVWWPRWQGSEVAWNHRMAAGSVLAPLGRLPTFSSTTMLDTLTSVMGCICLPVMRRDCMDPGNEQMSCVFSQVRGGLCLLTHVRGELHPSPTHVTGG